MQGYGGLWLRLICVLSLLMVGFGHRPFPSGASGVVTEVADEVGGVGQAETFAFYALPDGSLPFICSVPVPVSESEDGPTLTYQGCDACRIVASFCLTTPFVLSEPVVHPFAMERPRAGHRRVALVPVAHDASPRAPPVVVAV
jgi:hypothetical protein